MTFDSQFQTDLEMKVIVQEYDPVWAEQFQQLRAELEDCLKGVPYASIEHVGSTSVPGLAAKPILDIDIVIQRCNLQLVIEALTTRGGYQYLGDYGIPDRETFRKPGASPARNLYACIEGSQPLRNHLAVRDICRRDEKAREAYGKKKRELAERDWPSADAYAEAKTHVLQSILQMADFAVEDLEEIRRRNMMATR